MDGGEGKYTNNWICRIFFFTWAISFFKIKYIKK